MVGPRAAEPWPWVALQPARKRGSEEEGLPRWRVGRVGCRTAWPNFPGLIPGTHSSTQSTHQTASVIAPRAKPSAPPHFHPGGQDLGTGVVRCPF